MHMKISSVGQEKERVREEKRMQGLFIISDATIDFPQPGHHFKNDIFSAGVKKPCILNI